MGKDDFSLHVKSIKGTYIVKVYYRGHWVQAMGMNKNGPDGSGNFLKRISDSYSKYLDELLTEKHPSHRQVQERIRRIDEEYPKEIAR